MIPGPSELILILLIVVMIFGAKRIPEIMSGLGKGIRTFKKAMDGEENAETPPPTLPTAQPSPPPVQPPTGPENSAQKEKIEPK
ncbi:MAG TPA: twin-arginine translocase TatA/TatE family subunit [Desulfomonilaceae bacterium]|nr:twin-arginine translocase TatA/TatE family subunit [Desulfomonilaceae bacterium]